MTEWVKNCQSVVFYADVDSLYSNSRHHTILVPQLRLFLDDVGLLRCGERIHNAPLSGNTKFPLLLPSKDHITDLVIHSTHVKQLHAGVNSTLTALRQSYWVPSGLQRVKTLTEKCVTCRKVSGTAYYAPDPPPLPKSECNKHNPSKSQEWTALFTLKLLLKTWLLKPSYSPFADLQVASLFQGN